MTEKIIIAGAGGQGIMVLGKVLAEAAMRENKFVTWLPAYGAEVRGGTAYCMVVISDKEVGSPYIDKSDTLIVMNENSYNKFRSRLKDNGLSLVNNSLATLAKSDKLSKAQPFTDIALGLGNIKVANMIALGFLLSCKKYIVSVKSIECAIGHMAPKKELIAINLSALKKGMEL